MAQQPGADGNWMQDLADGQRRLLESWLALSAFPRAASPAGFDAAGWLQGLEAWRQMLAPMSGQTAISGWGDLLHRLWQNWVPQASAPAAGTPAFAGLPDWWTTLVPWSRMFQPATGSDVSDLTRGLLDPWTSYLRWLGTLVPALQGTTAGVPPTGEWMAAIGRMVNPFGGNLTAAVWNPGQGSGGLTELLALPMGMWHRVVSSLSAFPGGALSGGKEPGDSYPQIAGRAHLERFLALPPFGYTREWQEQGQQATRDWLAFVEALGAYGGILARIASRTAEVVAQRFGERIAGNKPLETLRDAYDLYVDCAEDAYAEVVTAADYGKVSAQLMNAAMAVKRHAQAAAEEMANAANLPTRRELDTSHRQAQELRRQLVALQEEVGQLRQSTATAGDTAALDALRGELEALRAEVVETRRAASRETEKPAKPARASSAQSRAAKVETVEG